VAPVASSPSEPSSRIKRHRSLFKTGS
jgi:hypothetical protein